MSTSEPEFLGLLKRAADDPQAMPEAMASLQTFTDRLRKVTETTGESESPGGEVRATVRMNGELQAVWFDPRVLQRGGEAISGWLAEAQLAAATEVSSAAGGELEKILGYQLPNLTPENAQADLASVRSSLVSSSQQMTSDNPEEASRILEFATRVEGLSASEYEGSDADGAVKVRIDFPGMVRGVELDSFGLRDVDNIEFGERVLTAYREALLRKAEALTELQKLLVPSDLPVVADPVRAIADLPVPRIEL